MTPRLLALGLMMSLMMSPTDVRGATKTLSGSIIHINRFIEGLSYMLESDIRLDGRGEPSLSWSKWLKGYYTRYVEVPYYLSGYTSRERSTIRSALSSMSSGTCIYFRELSLLTALKSRPYLHIYPGVGCWSYIGVKWAWKFQYLSLSRYGCLTRPIIQHVMMHALGFTHEHSRPDRDKYIRVNLQSVHPKKKHFFTKYGSSNQVTDYDFGSIMQFGRYSYSASRSRTLQSVSNPSHVFGYATGLSSTDRLKINRYYECDGSSRKHRPPK